MPTAKDQVPSPATVVVLPPVSVWPLESSRVIVAPASPVPVMLKPALFSKASMTSSVATTLMTGADGTAESTSTERVTAALVLPAASVAVTLTVVLPSAGMSPSP